MITASQALNAIPPGLREPLIAEYQSIVQNFLEHRWLPSELSGGRFSEIVYTILDGHAKRRYATAPSKPGNFVNACRNLESNAQPHVPRSFQILIPRILPVLYEIRNNRSVGHVGGDVDPNHMDSVAVLSMSNWVMAELVRVFHGVSVADAQGTVDALAEMRIPIIWSDGNVKRVLRPELTLQDQLLLLIGASVPDVSSDDLIVWVENPDTKYVMKTIRALHKKRFVEFTEATDRLKVLPPGALYIAKLIQKKNLTNIA
jgi:hypothetical protein